MTKKELQKQIDALVVRIELLESRTYWTDAQRLPYGWTWTIQPPNELPQLIPNKTVDPLPFPGDPVPFPGNTNTFQQNGAVSDAMKGSDLYTDY